MKVSMIISFIMIGIITFIAVIFPNMHCEKIQVALYEGVAIGTIMFVFIMMIVILNKKINKYFVKVFF